MERTTRIKKFSLTDHQEEISDTYIKQNQNVDTKNLEVDFYAANYGMKCGFIKFTKETYQLYILMAFFDE